MDEYFHLSFIGMAIELHVKVEISDQREQFQNLGTETRWIAVGNQEIVTTVREI